MHVYLRDEPVEVTMRQVDPDGLVPDDSMLVPVAFFVAGNAQPSFRALLPPDTIEVLRNAFEAPVMLGVLSEEPEDAGGEVRAMVGLAVPVSEIEDQLEQHSAREAPVEPWRAGAPDPDAWRTAADDDEGEYDEDAASRTALLAFAPLVRITRKFPDSFGDELADLLETAISGVTRPALEARVDRMLDDL
jgi:hypothetical protein